MNDFRTTFNEAAERYHRARPGYPDELFDELIRLAKLTADSRLLEIGPGTGIATLPLARRDFAIHGIELGDDLARAARANLATYPKVVIETAEFESVELDSGAYDLVYAATAYHWIRQPEGIQKIARILKPGGHCAVFRHHHVWSPESDEVIRQTQEVYLQYVPDSTPDFRLPHAEEVSSLEREFVASGSFHPPAVRKYLFNVEHTSESYVELLKTFSDHIRLPEPNHSRLFEGIARVIDGVPGRKAIKTHLVILNVAQLRDPPRSGSPSST